MRKKIKEIGRMLGKLKPYLAPYAFQLFVSVFMIVISIGAVSYTHLLFIGAFIGSKLLARFFM